MVFGESKASQSTAPVADESIRSLISDIAQRIAEATNTAADIRAKIMPPEPCSSDACGEALAPCIAVTLLQLRGRVLDLVNELRDIDNAI
jgi:hypothetical protein